MISSFSILKMNTQLTVYISKQLKLPSLLPCSPLFNTPKNERTCQGFIGNRLPEVYNRGGCTLKHCGEKISDPSMEELNTKDDETNMTMRIPTSFHYTKHPRNEQKSKLLQSMTIPLNPCGMRMHFFDHCNQNCMNLYYLVSINDFLFKFQVSLFWYPNVSFDSFQSRHTLHQLPQDPRLLIVHFMGASKGMAPQILCETSQNYTGEASEGYGCRT